MNKLLHRAVLVIVGLVLLASFSLTDEPKSAVDAVLSQTKHTYNAVHAAHLWLIRQQADDGSWNYSLPAADTGPPLAFRIEATAWVLTSMACYGRTLTQPGRFQTPMRKGLEFLLAQQRSSPQGNDFSGSCNSMISHALGTYAVAQIAGTTEQASLRESVRRAAELIIISQDSRTGGWTTTSGTAADLATTYRQLAALAAAESVLKDPRYGVAIRKCAPLLASLRSQNRSNHAEEDLVAMAMGLICQMGITGKRDDNAWEPAIGLLLQRGPAKEDVMYNYYATQAVFGWEGEGSGAAFDAWLQLCGSNFSQRKSKMAMMQAAGLREKVARWRMIVSIER